MTSAIDISIIIVTWNTAKITKKCIDTINTHLSSSLSYEIIVADNDSQDNTADLISKLPHVTYFNTSSNLGFSKANNLAVAKSHGQYLFFLNSDMELFDDHLISMFNFLKSNPQIGLIGPQFLNPDHTIQASAFPNQNFINAFKEFFLNIPSYSKYFPSSTNPCSVWALSGGAMLINKNLFHKIGDWNEKYFMYFEDLDLCRQIRKQGLQIFYFPDFKVVHHHGASGSKLASSDLQWRRLIPGSIQYHGYLIHTAINSIIWAGQKWQKLQKKLHLS